VTVGQFFEIDSSFARGQMEANSLQESVFSIKKKCRLRGRERNICQHKCASVTFNSMFKDSPSMCFTFLDVFSGNRRYGKCKGNDIPKVGGCCFD